MKLLVFAHTPPPHHGQSYMVKLMLDGFGGDHRRRLFRRPPEPRPSTPYGLECYHVNARLSKDLEDIGSFRPQKFLILFWHCLSAIWCRLRYGVRTLYYVPAPGKHSAIWRDWLVMALCRPFFDQLVLHWHAAGMARWLQTSVQMRTRRATYHTLGKATLSIVLSDYGRADAQKLLPHRVAVVGNGIPDPCPEFEEGVLPLRRARAEVRRLLITNQPVPAGLLSAAGSEPSVFRLMFMAHCTKEKGLFDAVRGVILAQQRLTAAGSPVSMRLEVAGEFMSRKEQQEFRALCATAPGQLVRHIGFISGERKRRLLTESDLFCFPSHLESFGLVLAEAMAFGLPIVTTRTGALPEVMSDDYPGLVAVGDSAQVADSLLRFLTEEPFATLRERFQLHFTMERHLERLASALQLLEAPPGLADPTARIAPAAG
ncbi:MAG: glycosyltransferase family 4 protein [Verrucomicrobia bacterium]|nr:glycosyltransferase family 4 protein [Verrucomicrobiota bacterium]